MSSIKSFYNQLTHKDLLELRNLMLGIAILTAASYVATASYCYFGTNVMYSQDIPRNMVCIHNKPTDSYRCEPDSSIDQLAWWYNLSLIHIWTLPTILLV